MIFNKQRSTTTLLLIQLLLTQLLLVGCDSVSYYSQAISGQLSILAKRTPIEDVLSQPDIEPKTAEKLQLILSALDFAEHQLNLPAQDQYRTYVQLNKPYVVWNVVAADELSLKPYYWCFPIVGCLTYRGYFSEEGALKKAEEIAALGFDTYTRGVTAYSTLGWFNDPVLSTFIRYNNNSLRALIFHELAHQVLYVDDDTLFNESFAVAVEKEGMRLWFEQHRDKEGFQTYLASKTYRQQFIDLVLSTREALSHLYKSDLSDDEKRVTKREIIQQLRTNYQEVVEKEWGGKNYYKNWFEGPLNNAQLNSIATYHQLVPGFSAMIKQHRDKGNNLSAFYQQCEALASLSKEERHKRVKSYMTNEAE